MAKKKKIKVVPRTDANQGCIEHINRVRKERDYFARKLAEAKVKMMEEQKKREAISTEGEMSTIDALAPAE